MTDRRDKSADSDVDTNVPSEEFIRAFTQSQRQLFLYLLPLVGNASDADEVLQETNLIIWAKWKQFEPGTNFLAWGRAIARLEVFRFRRTHSSKLTFLQDDILELVAQRAPRCAAGICSAALSFGHVVHRDVLEGTRLTV